MAVIGAMEEVAKRAICRSGFRTYECNSSFYNWGRYVLAGVVIFVVLIVIISCSCVARRRRRRGVVPVYGTGWMAPQGGKFGGGQQHNNAYNMNGYNAGQNTNTGGPGYANPPPAYGQQAPQYTGTTFNPNDGYYGEQQHGYVQPPNNTYQSDNVYAPPPGPPPGK